MAATDPAFQNLLASMYQLKEAAQALSDVSTGADLGPMVGSVDYSIEELGKKKILLILKSS